MLTLTSKFNLSLDELEQRVNRQGSGRLTAPIWLQSVQQPFHPSDEGDYFDEIVLKVLHNITLSCALQ